MGLAGLCPALLGLITVGFVILGGKSVVMDLLQGHGRVPLASFWMSFWVSSVIHSGLGVLCLLALFPFGIVLLVLLVRPPTWRLPVPGCVVDLVTANSGVVQETVAEDVGRKVYWVSGCGPGRKRIRLNRKTPAHLAGLVVQSRPRVWKRLCQAGSSFVTIPDRKRRRDDQDDGGYAPAQIRTGVG